MGVNAGLLLGGSYCAGLVLVSLLVRHWGMATWPGASLAGLLFFGMSVLLAITLARRWKSGPRPRLWLAAGLVTCLAAFNYGWRYPVPGSLDISHILNGENAAGTQQEVWGTVTTMPRLTRSGKGQFWLNPNQIRPLAENGAPLGSPEQVTGKLYVTVPVAEIADVYPGQSIEVQGRLYVPDPPKNPNGFNFQQYLADNHSFAGFSGKWVNLTTDKHPSRWALWRLRKRIAAAHQAGLGETAGPLVSAMALGRQAVNVPYPVQDALIKAGLAHTLAASGFHVSLVLGVVLAIMGHASIASRFKNPTLARVVAGFMALGGYVLLTGGQPSVLRASLMGAGMLIGLALERRVRPLGCLLLAVTLLLLLNPTWIDNVGFRLSVLATLGLIVTVKPLTDWLEWVPTTLAAIIAVPVAAYFWTIPLSLYYFNTLTTYSIVLNMVVTPLIMVLSLGGVLTGLVAAFSPGIGAMLAWLLCLPAHVLILLGNWEVSLPASSIATGHISLLQMFGLYGLYLLGWRHRWWRQRRWLVGIMLVLVAMGPLWYRGAALAEMTVLAAGNDAVMVVQNQRSSLLVNSGTGRTGFYTVVPFLQQAGINQLHHAVDLGGSDGDNWAVVSESTPIQNWWGRNKSLQTALSVRAAHVLSAGEPVPMGRQMITWLDTDIPATQLNLLGGQTWLMVAGLTTAAEKQLMQHPNLASDVLWWDGKALSETLIAAVGPGVAIASAYTIDPATQTYLHQHGVQVFCTERDGAITWNRRRGYQAYLAQSSRSTITLD